MPVDPFELELNAPARHRAVNRRQSGFRGDVADLTEETTGTVRVLYGFRIFLLAAFLLLGARVLLLQVARGSTYRAYAENNRLKREVLPALRGTIADRDGTPLATNVPAFAVELHRRDLPNDPLERDATLERIAATTGVARETVQAAATPKAPDTTVLEADVPERDALRIESALEDVPAVVVAARASRQYRSPAFAPVLGYVGRVSREDLAARPDLNPAGTVGRTGLEALLNRELSGSDGYRAVERDSSNQVLRTVSVQEPTAGDSVTVTLDAELQEVASTALSAGVERANAPGGALVALDPTTGAVLALVSDPVYDPTALSRGLEPAVAAAVFSDPRHPFLNRPIAGEYPSGSTIKPVIAAQALDRGIIIPQTTVVSTGGLSVGGSQFPDWKAGGHGVTDVRKALAESVNTFFYYLGGGYGDFQGLGLSGLLDGFVRFGFGTPTGIDLPGEAGGFLPTAAIRAQREAPWYLGDTYHLSIGQGPFAVTPLQLANATAAIANGGTLLRPFLVSAATGPDGRTRPANGRAAIRTGVAKPSALATVVSGMRQSVTSGSGRALSDLPLPFAGKTGTAQFGDAGKTHAWFTAFGPVNEPRIVVTVIVEAGGEGHAAALPVAHTVLRWWAEHRAQP